MRQWDSSPLRRQMVFFAVLVGAAVAGASCARVGVEVKADEDGTVVTDYEVVVIGPRVDDDFIEMALEGFGEQTAGEVEHFEVDGQDGIRVSTPADEFVRHRADVTGVPPDGSAPVFQSFDISAIGDDEGWTFNAVMADFAAAFSSWTAGLPADMKTELPNWPAEGGVYLTVTLPGTTVSTNGEDSGRSSATWALHEMAAGDQLVLETEPEGFPSQVQLYIGGAVLAVVLLIVLTSLVKRRRRRRVAAERAAARSQYRSEMMAPAAWQEPNAGSWGHGGPASTPGPGAPAADPSAVTFDPGTGRPLRGSGVAEVALSDTLSVGSTPPMAPSGGPAAPAARWAPPSVDQLIEAVAVEPADAPPAETPPTDLPEAGWYPDPLGEAMHRWWTGEGWSEHTD